MRCEELAILLPCHSLEDFPTHYQGTNADGLLAMWTALWQPTLIAGAARMPTWQRADSPPEPAAGHLYTVPVVSEAYLPTGWVARAQAAGATVVTQQGQKRAAIAERALAAAEPADVAPELAADLQAIGFAYLQLELLARRMRYASSLDEGHLEREVRAAAAAMLARDDETARKHLRAAVEVLTEGRERFYPVDAWLIDLTLVAETTLDESLQRELELPGPGNFLLEGDTLDRLAEQQPELLTLLRDAWQAQRVAVVGGHHREGRTPLLPIEETLADLRRGRETFKRHLGQAPVVYARRRFGLTPLLPQLLYRSDYLGALHFSLDDGQFPQEDQSKTRWEGLDGSAVDALMRLPVDAADPGAFLALSEKLGAVMDLDYVASLVFAHWPSRSCAWYDDLRRVSRYGPVFGRFVTLDDYFRTSESPGRLSRFSPDQYRAPYLKQDVTAGTADPLSSLAAQYQRHLGQLATTTLDAIRALLTGVPIDNSRDTKSAAAALLAQLPRTTGTPAARIVAINPLSFPRTAFVDGHLVEVPACGFACVELDRAPAPPRSKRTPVVADGRQLRNEHLLVNIDEQSGAIRSLHTSTQRGSVMSQQIALRLAGSKPRPGEPWTEPDERAIYSRMVAEAIETTQASPDAGTITSQGQLLIDDEPVARFEQRVTLLRGSRTVAIEISLDPLRMPTGDPWLEHYAARFAWSATEAEFARDVGLTAQPTTNRRLEAPHYVEIRQATLQMAVLTGGMPYSRRVGPRMLDTLLIVPGESRRQFRLGMTVGSTHPLLAALDLMVPVETVEEQAPLAAAAGWFLHLDARNVVVTHFSAEFVEGRVVGFRARILETEGRPGRVRMRAFRDVAAAQQVGFTGNLLAQLKVDAGVIQLHFTACEWMEIVARFVPGNAS